MSPLNRGPLLGPRAPPVVIRPPPPPRFGGRLPPPGMPPRMPPPPMSPVFGPMRQRLPPPLRPGGAARPNIPMPLFGPRLRGMAPMIPPGNMRGAGPRGPMVRPWPRRALPPQIMSRMRPRFVVGNGNIKGKVMNNAKKVSKLEELELKKPWMTDEIRSEIQKKNKLYAKAKKNKDAKEWEEFKDLRNKVTRMIRDAKNEYLSKHPEQAHLYPEEEPYDQRDENYTSSEEDMLCYCEVCDREFETEDLLIQHKETHKVCGIDGCTFSAHPLLVEKHINMQHSSGLYQRMKNLSTPEDIGKWLMERKKKYPTKANIELRKAEELEKVQRGEVIKQEEYIGNRKRKNEKISKTRDRKRNTQKRMKPLPVKGAPSKKYRGINEFAGTLALRRDEVNEETEYKENMENVVTEDINPISDDEDVVTQNSKIVCKTTNLDSSTTLPNLVADYGSDSDQSDGPEVAPIKKSEDGITNKSEVVDVQSTLNKIIVDTQTRPTLQLSHDMVPTDTPKRNEQLRKTNENPRDYAKKQNMAMNKQRPESIQLLYRLLSRSIQHERNVICQCAKYIVDNNFFD